MSRHHSRICGMLLLAGGVLLAELGGAGLAKAEPTAPPASAPLFQPGPGGNGKTTPGADAPRLASVDNFRDVAGTGAGYPAAHGRTVNRGVFYRSNAIVPNDADLATLAGLSLTTAYDLRGPDEITQKQDKLPAGVNYVNIPVIAGNIDEFIANIHTPEDARAAMQDGNRKNVTGATERAGYATLLTGLTNTGGAQVFHCSAGKDRTGWVTYLLLSIAGVAPTTIMDDYLLTNEYTKDSMIKTLAYIKQSQGEAAAAKWEPLLGVDKSYLQAGIDQLAADYGTVDKYLADGLGLSPDTINKLRVKLTH